MQSLMRSLSPEQRQELQDTLDALLRDDRLKWDLAQLAANLDQVLPGGLGERVRFNGDQPLGLEAALQQLGRLQALDQLEAQLDGAGGPGDLGEIDRADVHDLLGADAARDLDALEDLADRLERAGYLERDGDRLELTPRGNRRIGQKVLDELFARLHRDAFGAHRLATGARRRARRDVKPFEFGDPFHLDLRGTLGNALRREENAPGRRPAGTAIRLRPDDFEVYRTEHTTSASTVLLIDMSRSMLLRNCYLAAKKVAIALDTLIRTEYPRDNLSIVGFAYYARELRPEQLAELSWHTYEYGTNLQHGLLLARRILARSRSANKEIVVITDGEPTAHFEDGQVEFSYPPTRRTIRETLREVVRCTKDGITINTFMLERSPALTDFVGLRDRAQQGPRVLRRAGAPGRVRAGRLRPATHQAPVVGSPPGNGRCAWPNGRGTEEEARPSDVPAPAVPPRAGRHHRVRSDVRVPADRGQARKKPQNSHFAALVTDVIERKIIIPGAIIQGITGVLLIIVMGADMTSPSYRWLGLAIVLYLVAIGFAVVSRRPP